MKLRAFATALAAAAILSGCPGNGGVVNLLVVSSVEVTPGIAEVVLGQTRQLSALPKTSSGIEVTGRGISWTTSDNSIATVSTSGLVTAMAVGGPVRIKATVDGVVGDAVITVRAVPVDHVTIDPPTANILVGGSVPLVAKAFDANSVQLNGRSFLWESNNTDVVAVTTTGLALGQKEGGPVTITATSEGKSATASVSVSTRPATRLAFSQQPGLTRAGEAMTPPVQVELQDNLLTRVIGAPNPVTIQLAGNPGGATLSGQTTVTPQNGLATFSTLSLNRTGISYTFLVTSPGLVPATSTPFDVIAGSANQLAFSTAPSSAAQSGVVLAPQPVLQLKDGSGNNVAQANVAITASIATGPAGSTLGGTKTVNTNSFGVATFTDLSISGASGAYTLSFGAAGVTTLTSGTITLGAGGATALFIATQPSSAAQSNAPLPQQPQIQLRDAAGNNVAQAGIMVTASIASGGGAVGGNTSAITNGAGLAIFSGLSISGPAGTYTLGFSAAGLSPATSGPIVLGAGAQTKLSFTTQPSATAASGAVLAQQPVVQLLDASSNPVASAGVPITATVSAGGTLAGTVTKNTAANGAATFTDLAITGLVGPYTLTFTSPGLTPSPASTTITLTAGAATRLSITRQPPSAAVSGVAFAAGLQPIIQILDAAGNSVSQAGTTITAALATGPGGGTLGGTLTAVTGGTGAATFTNLTITGPSGSYTLQFTAPGLAQTPASGSVTLGAGAPTTIAANSTISQSATVATAVATTPSVKVTDGSGNPVAGVAVAFAVTNGGGTVVPASPSTVSTGAAGIASATSWTLGPTAGVNNNTVTATVAGLTGSPVTFTASGTVGGATQLAITMQPVGGPSGAALATQPVVAIRDAQGNTVTSDNSTQVTVAIFSGAGGTLGGNQTVTAANGLATFTNLTLAGTVGVNYVLRFTSNPALTAVNSNNLTVTAGAKTQLAITTQPVGGASGAALATQPVVAIRDAQGNTVLTDNATQVTVAIFSGAGGTLGGTQTVTAVNGIATFSNVTLTGTAGVNYVLRFTSNPVLTAANSNNVTVGAGGATQLAITTQPVGGASGSLLATQPVLVIRDAQNNTVTTDNTTQVTVAIFSGAGGTLGGTLTVTASNGVATFTNVTLAGSVGVNYVLRFTSNPVLTPVNSNNVTVTFGAANSIAANSVTSQSATVGTTVAAPPSVVVTDAQGNLVQGYAVTFTVTQGGGTVVPAGPSTVSTGANGVATASSWTVGPTAGSNNNTVTATGSGLAGSPVTFTASGTAGNPNKITITTQPPSSAQSGVAFSTAPVVQLRDNLNNPVAQQNVQIFVGVASGAAATFSPLSALTDASGQATFGGLSMTGAAGARTLFFSSPGFVSTPPSTTVTLSAGAANQLAITTQPVGGASGAALSTQPVIAIQDASGNTVLTDNTTQVTVAIASGAGGTLGGTLTKTAVNGVVTFTNVTLAGTVGVNYTLQFTSSPVLTPVTSNNVTVTAGSANKLGITTQPVGGASGAALATQPVIVIRDAQNNTVIADNTTQVTVAIFSGAGGALGGTLTRTAVNGVATFSGVTLTGTVGVNYVLQFTSSPALTAVNSNNVTVTAGSATKLGITTQPAGGASGAALATQPVIAIQDASGNTVTTDNTTQVTVAIFSGAGGTLGGTLAVTAATGVATFSNVTLTGTVGVNYVLRFTSSPVLTPVNSNNVTVTAGGATQLAITTQPVGGASGAVLSTQPVVTIRDGQGNTVTTDNTTTVTVAIASGAGGTLGGTLTKTAVNGVATFTNVTLAGTVGVNYTLQFTSSPVLTTATSNNVTVTAGTANKLGITTQPAGGASGAALTTQPVIAIQDASGNTVTTDNTTTVTVAIASGAGGTLGGTLTKTAVNGVATFTNVTLTGTAGTNYTLGFSSSPVLTAATSGNVTVTAGSANKLGITTQPVGGASGAALTTQPVIAIQDASGNTVATDNSTTVTIAIASGAGGTLGGTLTKTAVNGVVTFTNVTLAGTVGVNYTLGFTSNPALTAATSGNVTVTAGAANKLGITTQPVGGASGAALTTQPVVVIQDAQNNTVTTDNTTTVTVAIASGAGGTLGGTLTRIAVNGVVSFTNVTLAGTVGVNYTLGFTSNPVFTAATSGNVTVTAGSANKLGITTQPVGGANGAALATQPVIAIQDASGNTVTTDNTTTVTVAIASGAGGTLGGTLTKAAVNGVATFTNVTLSGTVGVNYTLGFSSNPVLTPVTSNNVTVSAGGASKLGITTQPVGGASGAALATQPVVAIQDGSGNTVTSDNSTTVTVAIASGAGGTLGGTLTKTAVNGVATFTSVTLSGTVGVNYTLQFTSSPVLTPVTSGNVTVTTGTANKLGITTQPVGGASGAVLATQPVIAIQDGAGNTVTTDNTTTVTVAIASGAGGALGGTLTKTAVNGVATFTNVTLSGTVGTNYTLGFSSNPVLTPATSGNVAVTAGAANKLGITTQPVGGANGAVLATQPVIAIHDAQGNSVTTDNTTTVTVAIASGAGGTLGGTLTKTAVNGVATFTNVTLSGTVGTNYTLGFSSNPVLTAATSGNVTVTAGGASKLGITTQPVGGASGAALATQPVIAIQDGSGNTITTDNTTTVTVAIASGAGGTLGGTLTKTAANGVATFTNVTLAGTVGVNYTLGFTSNPALTAATSGNVTVTAGTANKLGINTQPVGGASGAALTTQPVIAVEDAQGNTVSTDNTTTVTVAISTGAGGTLGGTLTKTVVNGVATFTNLTLAGTVGVNYTLGFTSNPVFTATTSGNVTVTAGTANKLGITTQPVGGASEAPLATQPVIAVEDAQGNTVTTDNSTTVTVAIFSGAGGTLGGTQTVTAVNGVATFTNVTLAGTVGVNYVLRFTSNPVLTVINSANVTVTPGTATKIVITTPPSSAAADGANFPQQPIVEIQDAQGNTVTSDNVTQVTAAINSGAGGTLGGTVTLTASGGVVTYTNLTISGTGTFTLKFTSGSLTQAVSGNITVSP